MPQFLQCTLSSDVPIIIEVIYVNYGSVYSSRDYSVKDHITSVIFGKDCITSVKYQTPSVTGNHGHDR